MSTTMNGGQQSVDAGMVNGYLPTVNGESRWEEQFLPIPLRIDDKIRAQKIEARLSKLVLCGATLRQVTDVFESEIEAGLRQKPSSLQMENTYVPELTDGTEEGSFLALDLGGTKFRVLLLELKAGKVMRDMVKLYEISEKLRLGPGEELFDFLAECVQDFVCSEGIENGKFSLGFTFSFPMRQHSISSGELITWTKSFNCSGMEGVDVAALLQRFLTARGLDITVRVLLNDTTGTLIAGAYLDRSVGIGVILGTGSNGCYMERACRVLHWERSHELVEDVCIDIEWGAFGDNGCLDFLRTEFDDEVDSKSLLVNSFTFEKYIGGKYLGDLVSSALGVLARDGLFPAEPAFGYLQTAHVSMFEKENCSSEVSGTLQALRDATGGCSALSNQDALVAQHVAHLISNRAAQLVSVCVATLVRRMGRARVAVAVDGSVFKHHPRIAPLMDKYVALLAPGRPFTVLGAEDGSGKGSALAAAVAARLAAS
uniref:Phosphotransferase n=1 Tax=Antheraea pernyi TaxID=7119 RepID=A0A289ZNI8_ANTPE|nr:hexokinase 1 [Antheraea pernyi]